MKFLSWFVVDLCSSFAAMVNLRSYRKKNRSLVECFLLTQNSLSVRMEWVILATNLLCSWLWWCLQLHGQFSWEWFVLVLFPFPPNQLSCHGVMLCCPWGGVQGHWRLAPCADPVWWCLPRLCCVFPAAFLASSTSSPCPRVCNTRSPRGGSVRVWSVSSIRCCWMYSRKITSKEGPLLPPWAQFFLPESLFPGVSSHCPAMSAGQLVFDFPCLIDHITSLY